MTASLNGSIDRVCLERAIAKLPACYRLVFELHDVQGYKHAEIAEMMDCSPWEHPKPSSPRAQKLRVLLRENTDSDSGWFTPSERNHYPLTAS